MTSRVLFVVGSVAGGAGAQVRVLAKGLAGRGRHVTIAAPADVVAEFGLADLGVAVERLEITNRPAPRADSRIMRRLRLMIETADVVHAHGVRAGGMSVLAAAHTAPVVVTLHNVAPVHGIANRAVFQSLERLIARRADAVLAVAPDLVDRVRARGADRVELAVVPGPAMLSPAMLSDPAAVRAQLNVTGPLAVVVGPLTAQKGLPLTLDVAERLQPTGLHWLVVGDGPERGRVAHRIDSHQLPVQLLGHRDDVPDLLNAADLVVSTAEWEPQPLWAQQALQQGTAIVATDVGGMREVVGEAAAFVPRDARAIESAIQRVLQDPAYAHSLRAASARRSAQLPRLDDALDQLERVYREVTDSR